MIVGAVGSGKSTIANIINEVDKPLKKTQDTIFTKYTVDVPSSYIQIPFLYKHAIALGQEASALIVIVDQSKPEEVYSPNFARSFRCKSIGIISHSNQNIENRDICIRQLKSIGVDEPYFMMDLEGNSDIEILKSYLLELKAKVK